LDKFGRRRRRIVVAQHDDASLVLLATQTLGSGKASRPTTDNHDFAGRSRGAAGSTRLFRLVDLLLVPHEDLSAALLD